MNYKEQSVEIFKEYVSSQINEGYKCGHAPDWNLILTNISFSELSNNSLNHIGNQIINGFDQGEIFEDEIEAWWQLKKDMS